MWNIFTWTFKTKEGCFDQYSRGESTRFIWKFRYQLIHGIYKIFCIYEILRTWHIFHWRVVCFDLNFTMFEETATVMIHSFFKSRKSILFREFLQAFYAARLSAPKYFSTLGKQYANYFIYIYRYCYLRSRSIKWKIK